MPSSDVIVMETLGGFPNLPALWLQRAKPAYAYAHGILASLEAAPYVPSESSRPPARRA
jgi:hypothetical protein